MYKIYLGKMCPTDSCICINDKEYSIESDAWNLISIIYDNTDKNTQLNREHQNLLEYIYNNFDKDLVNKPVETTKEQPKLDPLYTVASKLVDARNFTHNLPIDIYHKICDLEKEIIRLVV